MAQVPLEAILAHDPEALAAVKHLLDGGKAGGGCASQNRLLSPRAVLGSPCGFGGITSPKAGGGGQNAMSALMSPRAGSSSAAFPACLPSPFLSMVTEFGGGPDDDFDSSAETDWDVGSQVTDMCDSCCSD